MHILKYFKFSHLPAKLQSISEPFAGVAEFAATNLPAGPELDAGLRKLLEAKDCMVRAAMEEPVAAVDLLAENPVPTWMRNDRTDAFLKLLHREGANEFDWEIMVIHYEQMDGYVCELFRIYPTIEPGCKSARRASCEMSQLFPDCASAVLWAHKFDVSVFVFAEELYPEDDE